MTYTSIMGARVIIPPIAGRDPRGKNRYLTRIINPLRIPQNFNSHDNRRGDHITAVMSQLAGRAADVITLYYNVIFLIRIIL